MHHPPEYQNFLIQVMVSDRPDDHVPLTNLLLTLGYFKITVHSQMLRRAVLTSGWLLHSPSPNCKPNLVQKSACMLKESKKKLKKKRITYYQLASLQTKKFLVNGLFQAYISYMHFSQDSNGNRFLSLNPSQLTLIRC